MVDGSTDLLKKIYFRLISFLRKRNIQVPPIALIEKMEEMVAEHEAKPQLDEMIKKDIDEMID